MTKLECSAILFGIRKYRCYVEDEHFKVVIDHHSLKWLMNLRNSAGCLARWILEILQYYLEVKHQKSIEHIVLDCLSRTYEDGEI